MAGHRKDPPAGLWESICEQMDSASDIIPEQKSPSSDSIPEQIEPCPKPMRNPAVIRSSWRKWPWVAAASVLALVGFFFLHSNSSDEPSLHSNLQVSTSPTAEAEPQPPLHSASQASRSSHAEAEPQPSLSRQQVAITPVKSRPLEDALGVPLDHPDSSAHTPSANPALDPPSSTAHIDLTEQRSDTESNDERSQQVADHQSPRHESASPLPHSGKTPVTRQPSASGSHKWSIGVNASGGLLAAQSTTMRNDRIYYDFNGINKSAGSYSYSYFLPRYSYVLTDYVSDHHLPIRFGLSLDCELSPRLTLLSGLSYTYLYSKLSLPLYPETTIDQELHYIGIPLGLSWQWWSSQHIQLYVSGDVTVEKCLNDSPWQWSTHAAAGAEYLLFRQIGFYVEPSLGYYFDDGSRLEHYYKKHPLTPSLEFGLRMHLNQ